MPITTIQIEADGGFHGEVFPDAGKWGYRVHECLFIGNKNCDPDFRTFEPSRRWWTPGLACQECCEEIEARQAADKARAEAYVPSPDDPNEYNPFAQTGSQFCESEGLG